MGAIIETNKFDFNTGLSLTPEELEAYRLACVNRLITSPDKAFTMSRTGNMYTIAMRIEGAIVVTQAEGYIQYHYKQE